MAVAYLVSESIYGAIVFGLTLALGATAGNFLLAPVYYKHLLSSLTDRFLRETSHSMSSSGGITS